MLGSTVCFTPGAGQNMQPPTVATTLSMGIKSAPLQCIYELLSWQGARLTILGEIYFGVNLRFGIVGNGTAYHVRDVVIFLFSERVPHSIASLYLYIHYKSHRKTLIPR